MSTAAMTDDNVLEDEPTSALQSFRLLDLPQELQDRIYKLYYGTYDVVVSEPSTGRHEDIWFFQYKYSIDQAAEYIQLETTCRKIRADSSKIRKEGYSGRMIFHVEHMSAVFAFANAAQSIATHLRWMIDSTTAFDVTRNDYSQNVYIYAWKYVLKKFQHVEHIVATDATIRTKNSYKSEEKSGEEALRPTTTLFEAGKLDSGVSSLADRLAFCELATYLHAETRLCKLHFRQIVGIAAFAKRTRPHESTMKTSNKITAFGKLVSSHS